MALGIASMVLGFVVVIYGLLTADGSSCWGDEDYR